MRRRVQQSVLTMTMTMTMIMTHDGERRGFTVKPTAKYVDECLDIFNRSIGPVS